MFEIFKTNIHDEETASRVLSKIREAFKGRPANIDLEDCDRVLRIYGAGDFDKDGIMALLDRLGIEAAVIN